MFDGGPEQMEAEMRKGPLFRNRRQAGQALARVLSAYADRRDVLVLALPRGGVPVGFEVAEALHAPLDVFIVRKLGVPGREEYAMGAIASGGVRVLNESVARLLHISDAAIEEVARTEQQELQRRERLYRDARPPPKVRGRTVLVVDDGLATGSTMRVAVRAVRRQAPARVVVAAPVAAPEACELLRGEADDVVCAEMPSPFWGVGRWYLDFSQTSDEEVCRLLHNARRHSPLS